ncbi:MAG: hypothetical protein RLZZ399_1215 [Verrucomicrobiota bacterium]
MRFLRILGRARSLVPCRALPLLPLLLAPFLSACASLQRPAPSKTHGVFRTSAAHRTAPKPLHLPIATLPSPPPGSRILGHFQLTTPNGPDFAKEALLYYARHVGADAVCIRSIENKPACSRSPLQNEVFPITREFSDRVWIAGHGGLRGRWEYRRRTEILWLNQSVPAAGRESAWPTTLKADLLRLPESA